MLDNEPSAEQGATPEYDERSAKPEGAQPEPEAPQKPRRTTRKRTTKAKAAASAAPEQSAADADQPADDQPTKERTPRKRAAAKRTRAKKAAAAPEPVEESTESSQAEPGQVDSAAEAPAANAEVAPAVSGEQTADQTPESVETSEPGPAGETDEPAEEESVETPAASEESAGPIDAPVAVPRAQAVTFQPPTVLFQPPTIGADHPAVEDDDAEAEPAPSRRRRSRGRAEAEPEESVEVAPAVAESDTHAEDDTDNDDDGDDGGRRRRRRRGGRRRNKSGADEDGSEALTEGAEDDEHRADEPAESHDDAAAAEADEAEGEEDGDEESAGGSRRRRRRRRRRGESLDSAPDDPEHTVVKVREPRRGDDEPSALEGSTRLEAKKQRRREGREAGRRRPPILTEAEFLARRESVARTMVIRQHGDRTQIAVLEDDVLVEHYVTREAQSSMIGNVYLGRVQNVLPSMEAAFIDIGRGRNAVLYAGEVDWNGLGHEGQPKRIEAALKSGQSVLVQVTKDPIGHKGARLTSQISLPGRYLVYVPRGSMNGISRKLPDTERSRLKQLLKDIVPDEAGVVVRTAAEGASEEELSRDVARLKAQWEAIEKKAAGGQAPNLLLSEPDLLIKVVRDLFTEDFARLVVSGDEAWDMVEGYVDHVAPHLADRLERWTSPQDVFGSFRIEEQIVKALDRKVWLPSGGSLVIDRTEAMTVIDVNTGKFTGSGGNLEETVTRNNLEAAEEIVRQLRLRDIGGIIVVDFIDMVLESNRDLVLRRLVECLGRDRTKHQVAEVTSLGLVQMTRKRIGTGLLESFSEPCEACNGRGVKVRLEPVEAHAPVAATTEEEHGRRSRRRRRGGGGGGTSEPAEAESAEEVSVEHESTEVEPAEAASAQSQSAPTQPAHPAETSAGTGWPQTDVARPEQAEATGGADSTAAGAGTGASSGEEDSLRPREEDASTTVADALEPDVEPVEQAESTSEGSGRRKSGERGSRRRSRKRVVAAE
ncbi:Rne/Rng family ribonuclease [Actinopolymorpha pittospori]|uniref:Ribonuclease E n=1 Tax=Actinopolymorpha pittospori TaxID=648752 RepID=A0A927N759_9ACTN|nr:ribonuclease E [Actinopolymorpha pittospori]